MKRIRSLFVPAAAAACLFLLGCATPRGVARMEAPAVSPDAALSLWNDGAPAKAALVAYIGAVTDPDGPDYIPPEDRVAVFDLDGTLFCETDPNYFDYTLLVYRVTEDPDYRDRASEAEKETARKILEMNRTGVSAPGLETDHGRAVASAFADFTPAEFDRYVQAFKRFPMPGYDGMARGDGWYRPMLQVVDCLLASGFKIWVVSGTDRFIVRAIAKGAPLNVPPERIIGSDETIVAQNQNGADGLHYQFGEGDEIVFGGTFVVKNLKMNKVTAIFREIGRRPVLAFGNSTGDSSMAAWTARDNPRRALAFMLCCDDVERENGNPEKAAKMRALCAENGWIPVSMKDDWKTIYGDGVTRRKNANGTADPSRR